MLNMKNDTVMKRKHFMFCPPCHKLPQFIQVNKAYRVATTVDLKIANELIVDIILYCGLDI